MVAAPGLRPRVRSSLRAWRGTAAVALAAWAWCPAAIAAEADAPALRIADDEYSLGTHAVIYRNEHPPHYNDNRYDTTTWRTRHFARVGAQAPDGSSPAGLGFAVEALPDKAAHRYCDAGETRCYDIEIRARRDTGLLYVGINRPYSRYPNPQEHAMNDYPAQRMEISAEDASARLKVYRDVLVKPSAKRPDCADFGADDADRFGCLFLREDLPPETATTTAALRAALPADLVQPAAEYGLVFAEEFNGNADETHSGCHDGLRTLDADLWNHDDDPCAEVDVNGVACGNVENGYYYMALATVCRAGINTLGGFAYKYGYLEVKYTVNLAAFVYFHNHAFVVGSGKRELINRHDRYGIDVAGYGDLLRTVETEVDIFEYVAGNRYDIFHQYVNWEPQVARADMEPRRTIKMYQYCRFDNIKYRGIRFEPSTGCTTQDEVTVTKGLEWTPRGYRNFVRVDGVHDDFMVLPKEHIEVEYRAASTSASGTVTFASDRRATIPEGSERDRFFEFLDPDDADSVLEQVGVAHMPLHLGMAAWGGAGKDVILTKLRVDYIRVFQPANLYADMDPVYQ